MKCNKWTLALATAGVVSFGSVVQAEEAKQTAVTAQSAVTISGYVDTSAILNFASDANAVPGRSFDGTGKQDGINLNVVKLSIGKAPDAAAAMAAGYQVDLLFGPDANTYNTLSVNAGDGDPAEVAGARDFAIKNANITLRADVGTGLTLKIGFWDTIIGMEVFEAGNNPNYSRSYGYAIEPTQHTGVLASYTVSDALSVSAGVAETYFANINARSGVSGLKTYMASVALTLPDGTGPLAGTQVVAGFIDGGMVGTEDVVNYYVGAIINTSMEGLKFGISGDRRENFIAEGVEESAIAVYGSFKASEKLTLHARGEYAWIDGDGIAGDPSVWAGTLTADYKLWDNVTSRLEFRYDKAEDGLFAFGDGTDDDASSLALNIIYNF